MERTVLLKNLTDAGCGKDLSEEIATLLNENKINEAMTVLAKHRKSVLDNCHAEQKKIDCLDYLVYRLKKENL
ncbi:MAG: hypothetical protein NC183_07075 [Corallococcus sp.]|nr:hypothetical protein [Corallococcus sp.]